MTLGLFRTMMVDARTALAIRAFLRHRLTPEDGRALTQQLLRDRDQSFLMVLEQAIYKNSSSPYLKLLRHAGIALEDIQRDVREIGLEAALERLYDAGVYITIDEFKGRAPIRREGLEIPLEEADFSNPLAGARMDARTSGSRGAASYEQRTFDRLTVDAGSNAFFFNTRRHLDRPWAEWRQGEMYWPIFYAKFNQRLDHSFSTIDHGRKALGWSKYLTGRFLRILGPLIGIPVTQPEYVPASNALRITRWLGEQKARGTPALIHVHSSSALRLCQAAQENGIDISGTAMSVSGEPFTPAKARVIAETGVQVDAKYSAVEFGSLGRACTVPIEVDEVHLNLDKVALIQRSRAAAGGNVGGLFFTGLLSFFPKVMLNLEIGDYATVYERDCGCPSQQLGLTTHLSGIRSYQKLTSEGVTFLGGELISLVEEKLPARFGGQVGDYQLVEEEDAGVSRISIVVSPAVGQVDEAAVVETVLQALSDESFSSRDRMGEIWRGGNVLRVVRREPLQTGGGKVLPLHSLGASRLESGARVNPVASRD